jgi:hypothetical protein
MNALGRAAIAQSQAEKDRHVNELIRKGDKALEQAKKSWGRARSLSECNYSVPNGPVAAAQKRCANPLSSEAAGTYDILKQRELQRKAAPTNQTLKTVQEGRIEKSTDKTKMQHQLQRQYQHQRPQAPNSTTALPPPSPGLSGYVGKAEASSEAEDSAGSGRKRKREKEEEDIAKDIPRDRKLLPADQHLVDILLTS